MTRTLLFTVHGIYNGAENFGDILRRWCLVHDAPVTVEEIVWGKMRALQMWLAAFLPPLEWRRQNKVAAFIRAVAADYNRYVAPLGVKITARPSIVAHSKGTDLIVDTLLRHRDVVVDALVLIGSVLRTDFRRSPVKTLLDRGQINRVLVLWSANDSTIANLAIWPYGKLGARGFDHAADYEATGQLRQLETTEEHSSYFWSEFRDEHFRRILTFITRPAVPQSLPSAAPGTRAQSLIETLLLVVLVATIGAATLVILRLGLAPAVILPEVP